MKVVLWFADKACDWKALVAADHILQVSADHNHLAAVVVDHIPQAPNHNCQQVDHEALAVDTAQQLPLGCVPGHTAQLGLGA